MLFKANQSSLCQGGVDLGGEDDEMVWKLGCVKVIGMS